jgi:glycosyltransferase involved in cell wall biosynthesis
MVVAAASPLVSVIMPAHNAAAFIGEAIASVLAQTFRDLELIVVDDASTDDTTRVVEEVADPRVRLLRLLRNAGPVGARNAGLDVAHGRYVALLDADDVAHPERIAHQIELLERSGADVCAAAYERWNPSSGRRRSGFQYARDADLRGLLAVYCPVGNSTVTLRADVMRNVRYDARYKYAEDYELWTRLAARGCRFVASKRVLMTYRQHDAQHSVRNVALVHAASDAVRTAYLERLGIDVRWAPRRLPWRERLAVGTSFLRQLRHRVGPVSVGANYEIYARFQFRGNGLLTPLVRLERLLAAAWARYGPPLGGAALP